MAFLNGCKVINYYFDLSTNICYGFRQNCVTKSI
ncbi:hypothetical protein BRADI_3g07085v3 [Brachypodium distachyon]|uniref:Uncharacterized protein n=1 Tax=Brachypodium distachyon TaxID=15368 RepID=A0A2K2CVP7_BRADI|nr:hypothetical protein BRADI_3g07085v3 [Brachypodium distachyon]